MNRMMKVMGTSLLVILLTATTVIVVLTKVQGDPIDDLVKYSYETPEITTDLQDGSFVRIQFQIITDGKKAKNEISKRDFQLKNILIKELTILSEDEFKNDLDKLESIVLEKLNELMTEGKVLDVYTISKILQ